MYNYDEYMRAMIGENPIQINRYPIQTNVLNTYNRQINIPEPTIENIDLYPEIFTKLNPIVINKCKNINEKPNKELVAKLTDEIYEKAENKSNSYLKDLIKILILNQLLRNNTSQNTSRGNSYNYFSQMNRPTNMQYLKF